MFNQSVYMPSCNSLFGVSIVLWTKMSAVCILLHSENLTAKFRAGLGPRFRDSLSCWQLFHTPVSSTMDCRSCFQRLSLRAVSILRLIDCQSLKMSSASRMRVTQSGYEYLSLLSLQLTDPIISVTSPSSENIPCSSYTWWCKSPCPPS